jgi:hypothetical protein
MVTNVPAPFRETERGIYQSYFPLQQLFRRKQSLFFPKQGKSKSGQKDTRELKDGKPAHG